MAYETRKTIWEICAKMIARNIATAVKNVLFTYLLTYLQGERGHC